jgi:hypothetical protein
MLVKDGKLYKRREVKWYETKPADFEQVGTSERAVQGWVPVGDGPDDKWAREAWDLYLVSKKVEKLVKDPDSDSIVTDVQEIMVTRLKDGTYELIGPKVQGNPEKSKVHDLIRHGKVSISHVPLTYLGLREFLEDFPHEGIVWHHPDGRMAKIKRRDFFKPKSKKNVQDHVHRTTKAS